MLKERGDRDLYVVASGITPSGKIHVGNFREVITVDLVARALQSLGKNVRFIYSWDNFDTFRKVPKNVPDPSAFKQFLRQPIARIPDPWGDASSYATGRIELFEKELEHVGISPTYRYQEQLYSQGTYAESIRTVLRNVEAIKAILNKHRTTPLADNWMPTAVYCSKCQHDETIDQRYDGEWGLSYVCDHCGHRETVDIRESSGLKLVWRVDWPMRWAYEQVDFEPGGKDHSSQGGSYDTGKEIIAALWSDAAPMYLQYDFVMIKGGAGKMSSSSGELYTLAEVLEVYEPQVVRWIFAGHRPNHDFSLSFDEDVIRIYEEFDRSEESAFAEKPSKGANKWETNRRVYELSTLDGSFPDRQPRRAGFRILCNRLQICSGDIERTFQRYYADKLAHPEDRAQFYERARRALCWLEKHASDEFRYRLHATRVELSLSDQEQTAMGHLRHLVDSVDLETIAPKELNDLIWKQVIHDSGIEPKQAFRIVYRQLIGRDQGPRLPNFLKEIGRERLLELI